MTQPDFWFKLIEESDSYCAIRYTGNAGNVVVPSMHWGHPVTALYDDLFKGHTEILRLVIPDTVNQIGGFVIDGCTSLHSITLPSCLEDMWQYAFVRSSLEEVEIPGGVTTIVPYTFAHSLKLKRVVCGSGMRKIYANAFEGCDALEEIVCGIDTEISDSAFGQRVKITRN